MSVSWNFSKFLWTCNLLIIPFEFAYFATRTWIKFHYLQARNRKREESMKTSFGGHYGNYYYSDVSVHKLDRKGTELGTWIENLCIKEWDLFALASLRLPLKIENSMSLNFCIRHSTITSEDSSSSLLMLMALITLFRAEMRSIAWGWSLEKEGAINFNRSFLSQLAARCKKSRNVNIPLPDHKIKVESIISREMERLPKNPTNWHNESTITFCTKFGSFK